MDIVQKPPWVCCQPDPSPCKPLELVRWLPRPYFGRSVLRRSLTPCRAQEGDAKEAQLEMGREIASVAMDVLFTIPFPWIIIMNIKSSRSTGGWLRSLYQNIIIYLFQEEGKLSPLADYAKEKFMWYSKLNMATSMIYRDNACNVLDDLPWHATEGPRHMCVWAVPRQILLPQTSAIKLMGVLQ